MPSTEPATATAISKRKNSWPIWSIDFMTIRATGWPAFSSAASLASCDASLSPSVRMSMKKRSLPYCPTSPSVSPSIGTRPLPSLPVDSAINCSAQAPKSAIFFDERMVILSRPSRPARPIARPSCTPGFSCGGTSGPQERAIASVWSRSVRKSMPAAAAGIDLRTLLDHTLAMARSCGPDVPPHENPGVQLGLAMGLAGLDGRDKMTILSSKKIADFGAWAEQLIAESTGKDGKGLVPIDGETLGDVSVYGKDRF